MKNDDYSGEGPIDGWKWQNFAHSQGDCEFTRGKTDHLQQPTSVRVGFQFSAAGAPVLDPTNQVKPEGIGSRGQAEPGNEPATGWPKSCMQSTFDCWQEN